MSSLRSIFVALQQVVGDTQSADGWRYELFLIAVLQHCNILRESKACVSCLRRDAERIAKNLQQHLQDATTLNIGSFT
jgi:hypothetical protein